MHAGRGSLNGCQIAGNAFNGILVRDGATVNLNRNTIESNGQYGLYLNNGSGEIQENVVRQNRKGAGFTGDAFDIDLHTLSVTNTLL